MTQDFADFLECLNSEGVVYVIIGEMAVLSYVPYPTTRDLDVLIEPTVGNAVRAHRAVTRWAGVEPNFSPDEFIAGDILSFGGLLRVEIHSNVPGTTWEEVLRHRVTGELLGVPTYFAGLDQLVAMKEAIGRPDKDVPDLKRLRRLRRGDGQ